MKKNYEISYLMPCKKGVGGLSFITVAAKTKEKAKEKFWKKMKSQDVILIEAIKEV